MKNFLYFFLYSIKIEQTLVFGKYRVSKNRFQMHQKPININKVNIKNTVV